MEPENDRETTQSERAQISRRRMLWIVTSAGIIGTGVAAGANRTGDQRGLAVLNASADTVTTDDMLFQDDFEEYSVGSFPENWSQSGNSNQQVVSSPVASGAQALEMTGSYGGCWQALAHNEVVSEVPSDRTLVFSGHIHPTGTGGSGCHGNKNGNLGLQDSPSSAAGRDHRRKLIQFRADGTVSGSGLDLGSCRVGEYNSFEITYHWDSSTETVEVSYTVTVRTAGPLRSTRRQTGTGRWLSPN